MAGAQTTLADAQASASAESAGSIAAERRVLFNRMLADPGNLDIAFQYAALSAKAGDLEAAVSTLERMLIFAPGLPRLQLELGVLYYRLGAYETAETYFASVAGEPNVPAEVRARVETYRLAIRQRGKVDDFSGSVIAGVRYQTNANAAPDSRSVSLNGVDFLLDEAATGDDDVNAFLGGSLHYSHDLASQGDRFDLDLLTYGALYAEHDEINTGLAELTLGPNFDLQRFNLENTRVGVYGILSGVVLDQDPYLGAFGAGVSLTTALGASTRITSRHEYRREEYRDSDSHPNASDRDGDRFRGTTTLQHQLTERFAIFGVLDSERRFAERDYLSDWELGASIGGALSFASPLPAQADAWTLAVSGGYLHRRYDEPDPVIDVDDVEQDDEAFVQATLTVPVKSGWSLQAQSGYRNAMSNYDTRSFDNVHGSLAVVKAF
jgi:tetratricopeptide (TPR) repeat protein